jgi:hypothetical protein
MYVSNQITTLNYATKIKCFHYLASNADIQFVMCYVATFQCTS